MRENFYVFLNIDSALLNASDDIEKTSKDEKEKANFNPEGVDALQFLFEKLGEVYDVNLVYLLIGD